MTSYIVVVLLFLNSALSGQIEGQPETNQLGEIPIGGVPTNWDTFVWTDCSKREPLFSDCSAKDEHGRLYVFFDGKLSKVSAKLTTTSECTQLPFGLKFGENIDSAAQKVSAREIIVIPGHTHDGRKVYSSDFVVQSSAGVMYSIELIADSDGHLFEVVERTNF